MSDELSIDRNSRNLGSDTPLRGRDSDPGALEWDIAEAADATDQPQDPPRAEAAATAGPAPGAASTRSATSKPGFHSSDPYPNTHIVISLSFKLCAL